MIYDTYPGLSGLAPGRIDCSNLNFCHACSLPGYFQVQTVLVLKAWWHGPFILFYVCDL
jgi:hypothetical protein